MCKFDRYVAGLCDRSVRISARRPIELGAPPPEATHIYVDITCLSAGTLVLPDGFEVTCTEPDKAGTRTYSSISLSPGQDSVEITTSDPDVTYEAKAVYENGASIK